MAIRPGVKDVLWMVPGLALFVVLWLFLFHYYKVRDVSAQIAGRTRRVEMVAGMRLDLASASADAKSAVLAVSDKESQSFAAQARAGTARVEQRLRELADLVSNSGTDQEKEHLSRFQGAFGDLQRIDDELLSLAVRNTNIKAFDLAFGPAAGAVHDLDVALTRIAARDGGSQSRATERLAWGALAGALRIQALLPPHIAEKSDERMNEIEARIAEEDGTIRKDLAELSRLRPGSDLSAAEASYARFDALRKQILSLSRENTNVRSSALSLDQDTKAMLKCQDALAALQRAIQEEPIAGLDYGMPPKPR